MLQHPRERHIDHMSRREFLRRSAGAAVALPSAAAILAACAKPGTTGGGASQAQSIGKGGIDLGGPYPIATPDHPVTWGIFDDNPPIADGLAPETGATLQIYNWDQYIWKKVVQSFCDQYKCDYEITTFQNEDEALAKIRTEQLKFDVYFPTTDLMGKMVTAKLIQPLNQSYIPNLQANVWPQLVNPFYDQGSRYTVPYTVYTTGIGYRRDVIPDDVIWGMDDPYDILWDSKYKGKVGIYDSYRDAMAMVLLKNGITDVNTDKHADIDLVQQDLLKLVQLVNVRYTINGAYRLLPEGQFDVHQAWSGDMVAGWFYVSKGTPYTALGYWFPKDRKGLIGNDIYAIPRNAEHPVLAHLFLDYMLDFKNSMLNFQWVGYQPPQNQADPNTLTTTKSGYGEPYVFPWMEAAVVRPEDFDVGYQEYELTPAVDDMWHQAWQNFIANAG